MQQTPIILKKWQWGLITSIFFSIVGLSAFNYYRALLNIQQAKEWDATPCVIEHLLLHGKCRDLVSIRYRYRVGNQEYIGQRYDFANHYVSSADAQTLRRLPLGPAICYVNPHNPRDCVFNKEFHQRLQPSLFDAIFWVAFITSLSISFNKMRKLKRNRL